MTPCQHFKKSLLDLVDGELDILKRKEVEYHLKECPYCKRFLSQMRVLRSHLHGFTQLQVSENFHVLLWERIRREIAGKSRALTPSVSFIGRWIPALGFTFLLIIGGFWMLDQKTSYFYSERPEIRVNPSAIHSEENFDEQVQYVIEDYPGSVSISRTESERNGELAEKDSLLRKRILKEVRNRMAPVSF